MQCKDIPDKPILRFLYSLDCWGCLFKGGTFDNSVSHGMPHGLPYKLMLAKMVMMIRRGVVSGCACGCRGDYEITDKGLAELND